MALIVMLGIHRRGYGRSNARGSVLQVCSLITNCQPYCSSLTVFCCWPFWMLVLHVSFLEAESADLVCCAVHRW